MGKKVLQVIENAYRCTVEEQDDPVVWITHAMKGAGADLAVLLRGNAVNYAVKGQDASGLSFGGRKQTQAAKIDREVAKLVEKGVEVYVVEDDAGARGLERGDFVDGIKTVARAGLPKLLNGYDQVWHW
jgi:sulfur transfer complex TusBCD TusB component (DsrH family)